MTKYSEEESIELKKTIKICKPENILDLNYKNELSCQVLGKFNEKGLTTENLIKLQKCLPIVYPWNAAYNTLRLNYNRRFNYFPMGIIMCRGSKDVQLAIKIMTKFELEFSVRSGGHSYLNFSLSTEIIIDLSKMNKISVISNQKTKNYSNHIRGDKHVIIGPGAHLGVVIKELSKYNLSLPTGSCVNTGVGGLSLGGGISPSLMRLGGLMCDHIVSVKMVLGNGKLIKISKDSYSDLFFAIKGAGGGNFGIITQFTFCPLRFIGSTAFRIRYKWNQVRDVFIMWQNFAPFTDRNLTTELDFSPSQYDKTPVLFVGQYEGSEMALRKLISKFITLAKNNDGIIDINHLSKYYQVGLFWGGDPGQSYFNNNSVFFYNKLSDKAISLIINEIENAPNPSSSIGFNAMRGAVSDIKSNETAFPHRNALFWCQIRGPTQNPENLNREILWTDNFWKKLVKFAKKVAGEVPAYINAPQSNLQEKNRYLRSYFGDNVDKLIEIKTKYDPKNIFKFSQSIPPINHFNPFSVNMT